MSRSYEGEQKTFKRNILQNVEGQWGVSSVKKQDSKPLLALNKIIIEESFELLPLLLSLRN